MTPTADGCHCEGDAYLPTVFSQQIRIQPGEPLVFRLRLGGTVLPVLLPKAVAPRKGKPVGAEASEPHDHAAKHATEGRQGGRSEGPGSSLGNHQRAVSGDASAG